MQEVHAIDRFLNDPWLIKARENATVQVQVPKVAVKSPAPLPPRPQFGGEEAEVPAASAQLKRMKLQKQSIVGEDYSRRFGSGDLVVSFVEIVVISCFCRLNFGIWCVFSVVWSYY